MSRLLSAGLFVVAIAAQLTGATAHAQAVEDRLDVAVDAFWVARSEAEIATAITQIMSTDATVEAVAARLRAGRAYSADVPRGRRLVSRRNRDGLEHPYVLYVPASYDAAMRYPVRIYLHGGVMRPLRDDGEWWPNNEGLARDDALVVLPASWPDSLWWERSQLENLVGLVNDLKREYNVDENRVHLLGISDGATGAYYYAFKATTPWAGFLPFIGHPGVLANPTSGVEGELYVTNLRNKRFFLVNGANDRLYPAASVERYVRLFTQAGVAVDFRPQADAGHDMRWWGREAPNIDAFLENARREPLPDRLTWETESAEEFNRAHWLVIDEVGRVEGESELDPFNTIVRQVPRVPLGINMVGELQNRPGLRILEVGSGSIAARSGVMADDIILAIDGIETPDVGAFRDAIVGFSPGQRLPMRVERAGVQVGLTLSYPADQAPSTRPAFPRRMPSGRVDLVRSGNTVTAATQGVRRFTLLLSAEQFDLSKPIRVVANGTVVHDGVVTPDLATLLERAALDQDRTLLFAAALSVDVAAPRAP